jgi:predicted Zn-dependent protease with MMP-like domain
MIDISDEQFAEMMSHAFESLPADHRDAVKNVAIIYADEPNEMQRRNLQPGQMLLGLYEGVPLSRRQGVTSYGPDKITLFKKALCWQSNSFAELQENIRHTLWHEVAHYFGLDHPAIHELEK